MVTRKIKHKNEDGTVAEVDIGALAANVEESADRKFVSAAEKANLTEAYSKRHEHGNKTVLDKITQALLDKWNSALTALPVHTHTKAQITDMPTAMKNPEILRIVFNGRPWEVYDGSEYKEIDITPGNIGAAGSSVATQSANGLMSAADKKKLDGMSGTGGNVKVITGGHIGDHTGTYWFPVSGQTNLYYSSVGISEISANDKAVIVDIDFDRVTPDKYDAVLENYATLIKMEYEEDRVIFYAKEPTKVMIPIKLCVLN